MVPFKIQKEDDNFYTVKSVPIFETHNNRGFTCDLQWMQNAIQTHTDYKTQGFRPAIVIGHNVKGQEKEAVGFLDNLVLKGKRLYADLVRVPKEIKEKLLKNAYPNRSVEVLPFSKRIVALALLGGTTPHFPLPQMVYDEQEKSMWYRSPIMDGFTETQKEELKVLMNEASENYSQQEVPEIYEAGIEEIQAWSAEDSMPEIHEDENGELYSLGEDDQGAFVIQYTAGAKAALRRLLGAGATAGRFVKDQSIKAGRFVKGNLTSAARAKLTARSIPGVHRAEVATRRAARTGTAAVQKTIRKKPLRAAAAAALAGVAAGSATEKIHDRSLARKNSLDDPTLELYDDEYVEGYAVDEETGVVYFNGEPIGEVATYEEMATEGMTVPQAVKNPQALPTVGQGTVVPNISAAAVGTESGKDTRLQQAVPSAANSHITPLSREDSDQFAEALEDDDIRLYELEREVTTLRTANQLMQEGRRAEKYQKQLVHMQRSGVPIGNLKQTIDFLMTMDEEQVTQYFQTLDASPKVACSIGSANQIPMSRGDDVVGGAEFDFDVKADYAQNREHYELLGVQPKDLDYARYVRTNANKL